MLVSQDASGGATLVVEKTSMTDAGTYTAVGTNDVGQAETSCEVKVPLPQYPIFAPTSSFSALSSLLKGDAGDGGAQVHVAAALRKGGRGVAHQAGGKDDWTPDAGNQVAEERAGRLRIFTEIYFFEKTKEILPPTIYL